MRQPAHEPDPYKPLIHAIVVALTIVAVTVGLVTCGSRGAPSPTSTHLSP